MFSQKSTAPNKTPKFFLTFAMRNFNNMLACPLDNKQIKDGYIKSEGHVSYGLDNSNDRKFKCFTLHPVINNKDIVPYTMPRYGLIGYDLNADSMKIYAGGWNDLGSNNNANKLLENIDTLAINGKQGYLYLDKRGKVHEIMYNKVINRAECLKNVATNINDTTKIFNKTTLDSSFTQDNYDINTSENSNNIVINQKPPSGHNSVAGLNIFYKTYGIKTTECFKLTYDKNNHTFKLQPNELIGIPIDKSKGIKVDRIFVDKSILDINSGYWLYTDLKEKQSEYSKYIQNIIAVLIENFPNGDIRIIDGQNFEIIKTEDFIKTYVQDKDEKKNYLSKLEEKRESMQNKEEQISETIINSNNTNTNENNKNNNESDWYLCSRWKQCWERCW